MIFIALILLNCLFVLIGVIMKGVEWGNAASLLAGHPNIGSVHGNYAGAVVIGIVVVILELYFALVAFSFYQELKSGNTNVTGGPV